MCLLSPGLPHTEQQQKMIFCACALQKITAKQIKLAAKHSSSICCLKMLQLKQMRGQTTKHAHVIQSVYWVSE